MRKNRERAGELVRGSLTIASVESALSILIEALAIISGTLRVTGTPSCAVPASG